MLTEARGDASNAFLRTGLGGWKLNGNSSFFTGQPGDFNCGKTGFSIGVSSGIQCETLAPLKIKKGVDTTDTHLSATVVRC